MVLIDIRNFQSSEIDCLNLENRRKTGGFDPARRQSIFPIFPIFLVSAPVLVQYGSPSLISSSTTPFPISHGSIPISAFLMGGLNSISRVIHSLDPIFCLRTMYC